MQLSPLNKAIVVGIGVVLMLLLAISTRAGRDFLLIVVIGSPLLIPLAAVCFFGRKLFGGASTNPARSARQSTSHLSRLVAQHLKDLERQGFKPKSAADG